MVFPPVGRPVGVGIVEYRFGDVCLAVGESNAQLRHSIRSILYASGFREIADFSDCETLRDHLANKTTDMVIADASLPGGDFCAMLRAVRHHRLGKNPFLLAITLTGNPTQDLVRKIVDSGADDLIVKPFSADALVERVQVLAKGRKPFVVTHDYIGPDRRKKARLDCEQIPLLPVPNPLRAKAVTHTEPSSLQRMIDTAIARINQQKMERYAVQVGYLIDRILSRYQLDKSVRACEDDLKYLCTVAEDLARRVRGTPFAYISELTLSLIKLAERMLETLDQPDHRDVELLPKISQALARAFEPQQTTKQVAHEISESVTKFTAR